MIHILNTRFRPNRHDRRGLSNQYVSVLSVYILRVAYYLGDSYATLAAKLFWWD